MSWIGEVDARIKDPRLGLIGEYVVHLPFAVDIKSGIFDVDLITCQLYCVNRTPWACWS